MDDEARKSAKTGEHSSQRHPNRERSAEDQPELAGALPLNLIVHWQKPHDDRIEHDQQRHQARNADSDQRTCGNSVNAPVPVRPPHDPMLGLVSAGRVAVGGRPFLIGVSAISQFRHLEH